MTKDRGGSKAESALVEMDANCNPVVGVGRIPDGRKSEGQKSQETAIVPDQNGLLQVALCSG